MGPVTKMKSVGWWVIRQLEVQRMENREWKMKEVRRMGRKRRRAAASLATPPHRTKRPTQTTRGVVA